MYTHAHIPIHYNVCTHVVLLEWVVSKEVSDLAVMNSGHLIDEEDIEVMPENIVDSVMDENVDISLIRKYFTPDAWMLVQDVVMQKRRSCQFTCNGCSQTLSDTCQRVIACDHCLCWFHLSCVGLKRLPKAKHWFCRNCH